MASCGVEPLVGYERTSVKISVSTKCRLGTKCRICRLQCKTQTHAQEKTSEKCERGMMGNISPKKVIASDWRRTREVAHLLSFIGLTWPIPLSHKIWVVFIWGRLACFPRFNQDLGKRATCSLFWNYDSILILTEGKMTIGKIMKENKTNMVNYICWIFLFFIFSSTLPAVRISLLL